MYYINWLMIACIEQNRMSNFMKATKNINTYITNQIHNKDHRNNKSKSI